MALHEKAHVVDFWWSIAVYVSLAVLGWPLGCFLGFGVPKKHRISATTNEKETLCCCLELLVMVVSDL